MIEEIVLKAGSTQESPPLSFSPGPITVIVGPNYSGKSKLIREIQWHIQHGRPAPDNVVLSDLKLKPIPVDEVDQLIDSIRQEPQQGELTQPGHIIVGKLSQRQQVQLAQLKSALSDFNNVPAEHHFRSWASSWFFSHNVKMLDGQSRIALTNDQPFGDLNQTPRTTFQQLFRDDALRSEITRIVHDAFGLHLVADPTNAGQIRLRLSNRAPEDLNEEQGLTQRSARFHNAATLLSHASDGTRAFCGILIEVMTGNPDLLLLDEPEAFLHPSLSYKLGLEMARQVQGKTKNIFVSTHSPNFLMGCVASGLPVNVVRMTYRGGVATARLLRADKLSAIMKNPLLRSAGVLSALFYESVIVTEGDTDRAFYQEINNRLINLNDERGISNSLFINANGKDAIPVIMEPLRSLGIPAAAIYDLDFVKDGRSPSVKRLRAARIPTQSTSSLNAARVSLLESLETADANYKRTGGINVLSGDAKIAARSYLQQLANFGIHLVPVGEVEGWLSDLNVHGHAASWLIPMFEAMGEEGAQGYILPKDDDVWNFIGSVNEWLKNPQRLGVGSEDADVTT